MPDTGELAYQEKLLLLKQERGTAAANGDTVRVAAIDDEITALRNPPDREYTVPREATEKASETRRQPVEPPRAGRGSSRDAWVAYAEAKGVEVDDDMDRDAVIAAVDDAKGGED